MIHIPETKRWQIAAPISSEADSALSEYPPILRQILFNRGIATFEDAQNFLEARKPPGTSPFSLIGIPEAIGRIQRAIDNGEKIAIYGDYDVDGVTATALLMLYFQRFNNEVIGYIPNRFNEGYGVKFGGLNLLKEKGVTLVITVDCGIRSLEEARFARKIGLDLIISDHHHPGDELPETLAIINPKQPKDKYPEKDLAGVGLAYKIVEALETKKDSGKQDHHSYLDLVALGTVADLAPLVGENRYLVRQGLKFLRKPHRQGIMSLIGVSGLDHRRITATDIGFVIGPRINAAGRLDSAKTALDLLTAKEVSRAAILAQGLEIQNRNRQKITRAIQEQAIELALSKKPDANLLFAVNPDFNPGVVGLAASRLTDQFYRPSAVGQIGDEFTRASCRSIPEFHITKALDQCADLLEYYGGHAAAAGFTVRNERLPELIERLNILADEILSGTDLRPTISVDVDIKLDKLQPQIIENLEWLQPTGYGNQKPVFRSCDLLVTEFKSVGKENTHLKIKVSDGWITYDAIAFRQGHWSQQMPKRVDVLYNFEINEFRGKTSLQLNIIDLKPSGT